MKPKDPLNELFANHNPTPPSPPDEWERIEGRLKPTPFPWGRLTAGVGIAACLLVFLSFPRSSAPPETVSGIDTAAYFEDAEFAGEEYLALLQSL